MLLQAAFAATDPSHVDYEDLRAALAKITAVADDVRCPRTGIRGGKAGLLNTHRSAAFRASKSCPSYVRSVGEREYPRRRSDPAGTGHDVVAASCSS